MIKGGSVGYVCSGVVGDDGNVIAHFVLIWVPEKWIERLTYGDVCRPGIACVGAIRIEQLRIRIVCGISGVEPDNIDASIRSY